ncbi:MAG: hypothetical protein ABI963_03450 [Rhizomicrobium sp.]
MRFTTIGKSFVDDLRRAVADQFDRQPSRPAFTKAYAGQMAHFAAADRVLDA